MFEGKSRSHGRSFTIYLAQQDVTSAESILTAALSPDTPMQTIGQWLIWYARAELAQALGDPGLALGHA